MVTVKIHESHIHKVLEYYYGEMDRLTIEINKLEKEQSELLEVIEALKKGLKSDSLDYRDFIRSVDEDALAKTNINEYKHDVSLTEKIAYILKMSGSELSAKEIADKIMSFEKINEVDRRKLMKNLSSTLNLNSKEDGFLMRRKPLGMKRYSYSMREWKTLDGDDREIKK